MTRYYALTLKTLGMGHVPPHESESWGRYEVVMADEAEAEIAELREALEWYADPANTTPKKDGFGGTITECECDEGQRARAVLAKYEEEA